VEACSRCGAPAPAGGPPLTWVSSVERGGLRWYCDACAREHLRSIEGKLDAEWWS
jgi:hypothetical protein